MSEENLANEELGVTEKAIEMVDEAEVTEALEAEDASEGSEETEAEESESGEQEEKDPAAGVVQSASEVIERAKAALSESRQTAPSHSRDVPVSSIVHLMGLATAKQLGVVEKQLDILTNRLTLLTTKIDRITTQLEVAQDGATLDRIDFQLADMKSILKKVLPHAMTGFVEGGESGSRPIVVSSSTPEEEDLRKAQQAEEYQRSEAERVRNDAQKEHEAEEE